MNVSDRLRELDIRVLGAPRPVTARTRRRWRGTIVGLPVLGLLISTITGNWWAFLALSTPAIHWAALYSLHRAATPPARRARK